MREHIAPFVYYLEVHLLCASILCLAAWALTSVRGAAAGCTDCRDAKAVVVRI